MGTTHYVCTRVVRFNVSKTLEKNEEDSIDSIPSNSLSVKIQIFGMKIHLSQQGKTLLVDVNKLLKTKSMLTSLSNVLSCYLN